MNTFQAWPHVNRNYPPMPHILPAHKSYYFMQRALAMLFTVCFIPCFTKLHMYCAQQEAFLFLLLTSIARGK